MTDADGRGRQPRGLLHPIAVGLSAPVGIVVVLGPWLLGRLLGREPLGTSTRGRTGWRPVHDAATEPTRPWRRSGLEPSERRRGPWRTRLAVLVAFGLAVGFVWDRAGDTASPPRRKAYSLTQVGGVETDQTGIPAAFADDAWYPTYRAELEYAATWLKAIPLVDGARLPEADTTYINVVDGVRQSWAPPACGCRRLTVWVYGASTTFGLGQRDEHTIPSELARAAWAEGIALDVVNRGRPGEQHWQEADRLRWDLTRADPPDLVVFYDGVSEIAAATWLESRHLGDIDRPVQPLTEEFLADPVVTKAFDDGLRGGRTDAPPPPEGVRVPTPSTVAPRSPEEVGALAVDRYRQARRMSVALAEADDLEVAWFWQPNRLSRPPVDGEPTTDQDERARATTEAAVARLPDGVIDITDALDGDPRPHFSDDVHHNEDAAELIGQAMYTALRTRLAALAEGS